ncbi:MAG TPA: 16S rRNA (cytidine(1402)-2'-O)-methyltransferase [Polyangiales bacterium]|nr:16S rRNA (cytidine(1402)-2'-O)-methyltransferase [Polyangiales bacterium]
MSEHAAQPGLLSIVATPIGNLDDITLRALRVLREADVILAEDTRRTRGLCTHHEIARPLRALHAHSGPGAIERAVDELRAGKRLALVTDAGTPLVSDPGAELVRAATEAGVRVEAVPGASAVTAALTVAAIACDTFRFVGFLPRGGKRRREVIAELQRERGASVLFESPQRVADTLGDLAEQLGPERQIAVCRELTKLHEEVARGSAAELAERFADGARGEITIVIAGRSGSLAADGCGAEDPAALDPEALDARIRERLQAGCSARDVVAELQGSCSLPRQALYARVQACKTALADE